ncbi:MAG TPA: alpha/beta hydrolase [Candidatus Cottocaccamicrobium excrementipullorum]|nr:alpha/beta hydrolase [Candidatus Cottocaccamicrobium excrementipullorum]
MPLTLQEKEDLQEVLTRTGKHRNAPRIIPEEYTAYLNKVQQKELSLPLEPPAVPVRLVISTALDKEENCPIHINMHGGGFVFPQDHDDDLYCAHLAAELHGIVVDIDYAVSWDHPFPMAFDQSYAVVKWVFSQCQSWGGDPKRISVGGHSAGGCLAAAISLKAAATRDFTLCLQLLDYSALNNYQAVLPGGNERSCAFSKLYADGDDDLLKNPYCSPYFATDEMLKGLPPAVIINAGLCPFKKDNEEYGLRLAASGTEVTIKCFMNSPHGFTIRMAGEWQEAQEFIIRKLKEAGR